MTDRHLTIALKPHLSTPDEEILARAARVEHSRVLAGLAHLAEKAANNPDVPMFEDDLRGEMRRYLTATSPDAQAFMSDLSAQLPNLPLDNAGTTILVDTDDPTAPDGYGRTYYLTLTEIPR